MSRRLAAAVALAAFAAARPACPDEQRAPGEYEVKAVFLYNFMKYVEWPPQALGSPADPLTLCVLGRDPFGTTLDDTIRDERAQGRRLAARRLSRVEDVTGCQLLFISRSEERDVGRVVPLAAGSHVLTVSELAGFAERGGIIGLRDEENKVRFDINLEAAERAGLKLSAQLLKLGRIVRGPER